MMAQIYALVQKASRETLNKKLNLFPAEIKKQITDAQQAYQQITEAILVHNAHNKLLDKSLTIVKGLNSPAVIEQLEKLKTVVDTALKNPQAQRSSGSLGLSVQTEPLQAYDDKDAKELQSQLKSLLPLVKSDENAHATLSCLLDLITALINKNSGKVFAATVEFITPKIEEAKAVLQPTVTNLESWIATLPVANKDLTDGASKWLDEIKKSYSITSNLLSISENANISNSKFPQKFYENFLFTYDLFQKFYAVHNHHTTGDPLEPVPLKVALGGFALERTFDGLNFLNHQADDYAQKLYGMMFQKTPVEFVANPEFLAMSNMIMGFYVIAGIYQQSGNGTKPHTLAANLVNYLHMDPFNADLVESSIDVLVALIYYQFSCLAEKKEPKAWPKDFAPLNKAVRDLIFTIKSHIAANIASHAYKHASPESLEKFEKFSMGILKPELAYLFVDFLLQWILSQNIIPGTTFTPGQISGDIAFEQEDLNGKTYLDKKLERINDTSWRGWLWSYASPTRVFNPAIPSQHKYKWINQHLKAGCDPLNLYMRWSLETYLLKSVGEFWGTKLGRRFNGPVSRAASWIVCKVGHIDNSAALDDEIKQFKGQILDTLNIMSSDMFRLIMAPLLMQFGLIAQKDPNDVDPEEYKRAFVKLILQITSNSKYKIISPKDAVLALITYDKTHDFEKVLDQLGDVIKTNTVGYAFGKMTGYIASSAPVVAYVDGQAEKLFTSTTAPTA